MRSASRASSKRPGSRRKRTTRSRFDRWTGGERNGLHAVAKDPRKNNFTFCNIRGARTLACRVATPGDARGREERGTIPAGNVSGARNLGATDSLFPMVCAEVPGESLTRHDECVRHRRCRTYPCGSGPATPPALAALVEPNS